LPSLPQKGLLTGAQLLLLLFKPTPASPHGQWSRNSREMSNWEYMVAGMGRYTLHCSGMEPGPLLG